MNLMNEFIMQLLKTSAKLKPKIIKANSSELRY